MPQSNIKELNAFYTAVSQCFFQKDNELKDKLNRLFKLAKEHQSTLIRLPITPFVSYKEFLSLFCVPIAVVAAIGLLNLNSVLSTTLIPFNLGRALMHYILGHKDHAKVDLEYAWNSTFLTALTIGLAAVVGLLAAIVIPLALVITATRSVATVAHSSINFFSKKDNETENRPGNTQGQAYSMS